jgi:hypothetical protein
MHRLSLFSDPFTDIISFSKVKSTKAEDLGCFSTALSQKKHQTSQAKPSNQKLESLIAANDINL